MARPRRWTDQQREQALRLYVEFGPTEASKRTGIHKSEITKWAKARRIATVANDRTREATETIAARWHLKQERLIEGLMDMVLDALERPNQPHVVYVGRDRREVTYPTAPPAAFLAYVTAVEMGVKTLAVLAEKSAARTEQAGSVATTDAERAALRAAMEQELARRGQPTPGK